MLLRLFGELFEWKYTELCYWGAYISIVACQCFVAFLELPFLRILTFCCIAVFIVETGYTGLNNKIIYTILFLVYLVPVYILLSRLPANFPNIEFSLTWIIGILIEAFAYWGILKMVIGRKVKALIRNQEILTAFMGVAELCFIYMASQTKWCGAAEINLLVSALCFAFLVIDVYLVILFENVRRRSELEKQRYLWEEQAHMSETYAEQIKAQNENYRKIMHDIKKHLRMMKATKAADPVYCDETLALVSWQENVFQCSDPVLCRILNDKLVLCKEQGIGTRLEIDDVKLDFMRKSDITAIFMNLLDNAIEACVETEEKMVSVKIRNIQGNIVVVISNSCKEVAAIPDKSGISSKKGHMGVGLSNVRTALARYGSTLDLHYEEQRFISKFIIASDNM